MIVVTPTIGANFSFIEFVGFIDDLIFDGDINLATSTSTSFESNWVDPVFGAMHAEVTGTGFMYSAGGLLVGGVIDTLQGFDDGVLQGTVTTINLSASALGAAYSDEVTFVNIFAMEQLLLSQDWSYTGTNAVDNAPVGSTIGDDGYLFNPIGDDIFDLGGGDDVFFSSGGNDQILGGSGNDTLDGGTGNDMLDGGTGNDILIGGFGDDTIITGLGTDTIDGGDGIDTVDYTNSTNTQKINLVTNVNTGGFAHNDTLTNIENVIGSNTRGDDITGTASANVLSGMGADDFLRGFHGDDILNGGEGNDFLFGGQGADAMDGGNGRDWVMYNGASSAVVVDLDNGGSLGEAIGDTYSNIERIRGSTHNDTLSGDSGSNKILGDGGNDIISGRAGKDILRGGSGDDELDGGTNNDSMFGGAGSDKFIFAIGSGHDYIGDFTNDIDSIELYLPHEQFGDFNPQTLVGFLLEEQNDQRFFFDFGNGDLLHILSTSPITANDLVDDISIIFT